MRNYDLGFVARPSLMSDVVEYKALAKPKMTQMRKVYISLVKLLFYEEDDWRHKQKNIWKTAPQAMENYYYGDPNNSPKPQKRVLEPSVKFMCQLLEKYQHNLPIDRDMAVSSATANMVGHHSSVTPVTVEAHSASTKIEQLYTWHQSQPTVEEESSAEVVCATSKLTVLMQEANSEVDPGEVYQRVHEDPVKEDHSYAAQPVCRVRSTRTNSCSLDGITHDYGSSAPSASVININNEHSTVYTAADISIKTETIRSLQDCTAPPEPYGSSALTSTSVLPKTGLANQGPACLKNCTNNGISVTCKDNSDPLWSPATYKPDDSKLIKDIEMLFEKRTLTASIYEKRDIIQVRAKVIELEHMPKGIERTRKLELIKLRLSDDSATCADIITDPCLKNDEEITGVEVWRVGGKRQLENDRKPVMLSDGMKMEPLEDEPLKKKSKMTSGIPEEMSVIDPSEFEAYWLDSDLQQQFATGNCFEDINSATNLENFENIDTNDEQLDWESTTAHGNISSDSNSTTMNSVSTGDSIANSSAYSGAKTFLKSTALPGVQTSFQSTQSQYKSQGMSMKANLQPQTQNSSLLVEQILTMDVNPSLPSVQTSFQSTQYESQGMSMKANLQPQTQNSSLLVEQILTMDVNPCM